MASVVKSRLDDPNCTDALLLLGASGLYNAFFFTGISEAQAIGKFSLEFWKATLPYGPRFAETHEIADFILNASKLQAGVALGQFWSNINSADTILDLIPVAGLINDAFKAVEACR